MKLKLANIALDCDDVLRVAGFWSAALDRSIDKGSSPDFASIGGADAERDEPAWYFMKVPEPRTAKNRMHVDLIDPDPALVDELVRIGAKVVHEHDLGFHSWTVMEDPEGNVFCVATKAFTGA
jgi:hypothetical protein